MAQLLHSIGQYWTRRAPSYTDVIKKNLADGWDQVWADELISHFPDGGDRPLRVLDIGTGPGFYAIILARRGYDVTAVDYSEGMLREAKRNAGDLADSIRFDANWYAYLFNEDKQQEYRRDRANTRLAGVEDHEAYAEADMMEGISRLLPMGRLRRPQWDVDALTALGFSAVHADTSVGKRLWNPEEKINYASTPGFMVWATK